MHPPRKYLTTITASSGELNFALISVITLMKSTLLLSIVLPLTSHVVSTFRN